MRQATACLENEKQRKKKKKETKMKVAAVSEGSQLKLIHFFQSGSTSV